MLDDSVFLRPPPEAQWVEGEFQSRCVKGREGKEHCSSIRAFERRGTGVEKNKSRLKIKKQSIFTSSQCRWSS